MRFEIRPTREKVPAVYKTIYIKKSLADKIEKLARKHNTSFNNIVISILTQYLLDAEDE